MDAMLHRPVALGLRGLLAATVALPLLAFTFGTRQGQAVFVLYREPKLAAIQILGWSLLGFLFWTYRENLHARTLLAEAFRPPWRWLALFLVYGLVTGLWIAVPANLFYELSQYALLLLLVLTLGIWAGRDAAVPAIVEHGLVLSLGAAVLVGLVQAAFPFAILSPIDPGSGVANPSVLGYKNVMALAVVGQVFRVNCNAADPNHGYEAIRPMIHQRKDTFVLEPATQDDRIILWNESALPQNVNPLAAKGLGALAFLGLATAVIRPGAGK